MMTRQKSRLMCATELETANKTTRMNFTMKSKTDLIGLKHKKLKELFADELIKENDENNDNELQQLVELKAKPEQRILNKEMGKNIDVMQPLMTMDKELCPVTSESEIEEEQEAAVSGVKRVIRGLNRDALWKQRRARNHRVLLEKNNLNNIKLIKTPRGLIKKITYYDTWHFIKPKTWPTELYEQRQYLEFPLVKLANASTSMQLPSSKWSSKVTLYKVLPSVLKRHTLTMFSGDLKPHQIPEQDRQKYQPSSVIFRREDNNSQGLQSHVTYDRILIFRPKHYSINFDGQQVQLDGAPDAVSCKQDVIRLLDIVDSISMSNPMVEIVTPK